ncbi:hypothetical protein U3A58_19855, partial [Algoriphagus sp. C2-6-M1]|uniref:hypothetical protein n=1 Tax=Algoriphagus persicinus TaxID=3108754 RepID=UPI002B381147
VLFWADAEYSPCFPSGSKGSISDCRLRVFWVPFQEEDFPVPDGSVECSLFWLSLPISQSAGSVPILWVGSRYSGQVMHGKPSDKLQIIQGIEYPETSGLHPPCKPAPR